MEKIMIFKNYNVDGYREMFGKAPTEFSDLYEIELPKGYKIAENAYGEEVVKAPSGEIIPGILTHHSGGTAIPYIIVTKDDNGVFLNKPKEIHLKARKVEE